MHWIPEKKKYQGDISVLRNIISWKSYVRVCLLGRDLRKWLSKDWKRTGKYFVYLFQLPQSSRITLSKIKKRFAIFVQFLNLQKEFVQLSKVNNLDPRESLHIESICFNIWDASGSTTFWDRILKVSSKEEKIQMTLDCQLLCFFKIFLSSWEMNLVHDN